MALDIVKVFIYQLMHRKVALKECCNVNFSILLKQLSCASVGK